jgi:hypothetical protein
MWQQCVENTIFVSAVRVFIILLPLLATRPTTRQARGCEGFLPGASSTVCLLRALHENRPFPHLIMQEQAQPIIFHLPATGSKPVGVNHRQPNVHHVAPAN